MYAWIPIVHIAAAVFAIIELGLTGYLASVANGPFTRSPDQVNFMIFNSLWTLLVLVYVGLSPRFFPRAFHMLVALGLTALTMLFWFAGSIALAVYSGSGWCGLNLWCGVIRAAVAFGFFLWGCFLALTIQDALDFFRGRRGGAVDAHAKPHAYPGV